VLELSIMIMSGVDDGTLLQLQSDTDGDTNQGHWSLSIGRRDDNDITLKNDTFVSRQHARLHWKDDHWWLEDGTSTNGTFIENGADVFSDLRVRGIIPVNTGQLFRIGRTWLRIQPAE
jgi:pSer/pThr/pTyr-binding forkhead associated (FHA) protein